MLPGYPPGAITAVASGRALMAPDLIRALVDRRSAVEKRVSSIFRKPPLITDATPANRRMRAALLYLANCSPVEALP